MTENQEIIQGASLWKDAWKRLLKNKLAVFGLVVLTLMVIIVIVGPRLIYWATGFTADYVPSSTDQGDLVRSFPPSWQHPMGTDDAGRDLFARVLQGGRISLMVGLITTLVSLIVGVSYGSIAGYLGGRIDNFMMRVVDIIYAIPYILVVIVLLQAFGGANTSVLVSWIPQIIVGTIIFVVAILALAALFRRFFESSASTGDGAGQKLAKAGFVVGGLAVTLLLIYFVGLGLATLGVGNSLAELYKEKVNQGLSQIFLLFFAL